MKGSSKGGEDIRQTKEFYKELGMKGTKTSWAEKFRAWLISAALCFPKLRKAWILGVCSKCLCSSHIDEHTGKTSISSSASPFPTAIGITTLVKKAKVYPSMFQPNRSPRRVAVRSHTIVLCLH